MQQMKPHSFFFTSLTSPSAQLCFSLLALTGFASAGTLSFTALNSDADTGLSPLGTYTHLVDLAGDGATINGVNFIAGGPSGPNYTLTGAANTFPNNNAVRLPSPAGDGVNDLTTTFYFGGPVEVLTLLNLTPNATYRASFFVAGWNGATQTLTATDADGAHIFDRDGDLDPAVPASTTMLINYEYIAPASGTLEITFRENTTGNSFHQYGFFNELIAIPEPGSAALALAAASLLMRRRRA